MTVTHRLDHQRRQRQLDAAAARPRTSAGSEDRFLKLLVAQMQNQDPLNPMDNAQVTSQMAQINTVSGIDKLNTHGAGPVEPVRADAGAAGRVAGRPRRASSPATSWSVAERRRPRRLRARRRRRQRQGRDPRRRRRGRRHARPGRAGQRPAQLRLAGRQRRRRRAACRFRVTATSGSASVRGDAADARPRRRGQHRRQRAERSSCSNSGTVPYGAVKAFN